MPENVKTFVAQMQVCSSTIANRQG